MSRADKVSADARRMLDAKISWTVGCEGNRVGDEEKAKRVLICQRRLTLSTVTCDNDEASMFEIVPNLFVGPYPKETTHLSINSINKSQ